MDVVTISLMVVVAALVVVISMQRRSPHGAQSDSALLLKQDMNKLSQEIAQLKDGVQQQMGTNNAAMQQTVQRQFAASSRIITEVTERLTKLDDTNRRV